MDSIIATFHNGHLELSQPVNWPEGTKVVVTPCEAQVQKPRMTLEELNAIRAALVDLPLERQSQGDLVPKSYADFIREHAGSFGNEPFERPPQGEYEIREEW